MNINKAAFALKSLMKEIESDLKNQMKVEDRVPEGDTDSMKKLLEFTKKETSKRPKTNKPGAVEKGKKSQNKSSKSKHVKKSIEELRTLLNEISTYKTMGAQSPDARVVGAAVVTANTNPKVGVGDTDTLAGDEREDAIRAGIINPVNTNPTGIRQTIGGEPGEDEQAAGTPQST
jgi:hypothetical protein